MLIAVERVSYERWERAAAMMAVTATGLSGKQFSGDEFNPYAKRPKPQRDGGSQMEQMRAFIRARKRK